MTKPPLIRYSQDSNLEFQKELKKRVAAYFKDNGSNRKATGAMWFRVCFFFVLHWAVWAALAFFPHGILTTSFLLICLSFAFKGVAYNAVHDGCHQALSGNRTLDNIIYWINLSMLGPDPYLWKPRHNVEHHNYVNIPGLDSQIEGADPVFRLSPHQAWKAFHRFQPIYSFLVYSIVSLQWIFMRDFKDLFSQKFKDAHSKGQFVFHLIRIVAFKAGYLGFMVVIPSICLPYSPAQVFAGFIALHLATSWAVTMTFAISHVNESMVFVNQEQGRISHSSFEHQLLTSMDYHPTNPWVNFLFGGMSAHVAHHMFPHISSVHLSKITPIISKTAHEFGLPYHEDSIFNLVRSHLSLLKTMGRSKEEGDRFFHSGTPSKETRAS